MIQVKSGASTTVQWSKLFVFNSKNVFIPKNTPFNVFTKFRLSGGVFLDVGGVFGVMSGLGGVCFHLRKVKIRLWSARATPRHPKIPQTPLKHAKIHLRAECLSFHALEIRY